MQFATVFCVVGNVLLGGFYEVLGGCQGVAMQLLGCCMSFLAHSWSVVCDCQDVARDLEWDQICVC